MLRPLLTLGVTALSTSPGLSHEFWIDPVEHAIALNGRVVANLRVGQEYEGSANSYIPQNFKRFEYALNGELQPVEGLVGDRPAASLEAPGEGLVTLIHQTRDYTLTYKEFEKFVAFVEHKDAPEIIDQHKAQGLPDTGFKELYSRYAKSLIGIGDAKGEDVQAGLLTEIVALENPYTGDMSDGMDVQVFYDAAPRRNAQVEIFEKSNEGAVTVTTLRTNAEGKATIPVKAGHRYMLDSVVLRPVATELQESTGAIWESLWANLTFEVPD